MVQHCDLLVKILFMRALCVFVMYIDPPNEKYFDRREGSQTLPQAQRPKVQGNVLC